MDRSCGTAGSQESIFFEKKKQKTFVGLIEHGLTAPVARREMKS